MPLQELSSEGSDDRCKFDSNLDFDYDLRYNLSAWSALIVVLNRIAQTAAIVPIIARYAKKLGIARKATNANSGSVASAAHQDTQQPNAIKPNATNAAARLTKAL